MSGMISQLIARDFLTTYEYRRRVNRELHSFLSPRFCQQNAVCIPDALKTRESGAPLALYVGVLLRIRSDPNHHGYCLFPVLEGAPQLDTHRESLARKLFRSVFEGSPLASLYSGKLESEHTSP